LVRDWKPAGAGYPLGTWRFDVKHNGDVNVYLPRKKPVDFTTQFVVGGDQLTIEIIPVCAGETARYGWHASKDELELTDAADDSCTARAALFGSTWHGALRA
jgi:hypothetical protein